MNRQITEMNRSMHFNNNNYQNSQRRYFRMRNNNCIRQRNYSYAREIKTSSVIRNNYRTDINRGNQVGGTTSTNQIVNLGDIHSIINLSPKAKVYVPLESTNRNCPVMDFYENVDVLIVSLGYVLDESYCDLHACFVKL